jgi:hypothetical protein
MDATFSYSLNNKALQNRYDNSIAFVEKSLPKGSVIFDLGIDNPLAQRLRANGFTVVNTEGEDLDDRPEIVSTIKADATTAFEILEHLVNPLDVLRTLPTQRLFATVPLALWFAKAYRHPTDLRDRHFHEFEDWQFDWLLEKAGWRIIRIEKWTSRTGQFGLRPLLRNIVPRYYAVEAVRDHPPSWAS